MLGKKVERVCYDQFIFIGIYIVIEEKTLQAIETETNYWYETFRNKI